MNTTSTQKNKRVLSYIWPFRLNAGAILAFACLLIATSGIGQTTIFSDNFGTAATSPFTGGTATVPAAATYTASTATAVISTKLDVADGYVNFISSGTAGRPYLIYPFSGVSSDFNPVLSSNSGPVTWTVNMKTLRNSVMSSSNIANYADGNYNCMFILCSNSANLTTGSVAAPSGTNGYAVIYQRSSFDATKNGIRLVRFSNGLLAGSAATTPGPSVYANLIESAAYPTTGFVFSKSVKVVYTPSTGNWELLTRDDPSGTFVDPLSVSAPAFVSAGNITDATYTSTPMTHFGILASLSTSTTAANSFQFDNLKLTVTPVVSSYFYYNGTGALESLTSWTKNSDGTGSEVPANNPTAFTGIDNQVFVLKSSATTTAPWSVSGTGSKILVGNAASAPVTLKVDTLNAITGIIDIAAASSGSNSVIVEDATGPTFSSLHASSEVHYRANVSIIGNFIFGKLFIDSGIPTDTVQVQGAHTVATSLTVAANSVLYCSSTSAKYLNVSSAAVVINGTITTPRVTGFVSSGITPGTSYAALQFSGAENIILGPSSNIVYMRGAYDATQTTLQTITPRTDYKNLTILGYYAPKVFGAGATAVAGTLTLDNGPFSLTTAGNITVNGTLALNSGVLTVISSDTLTVSSGNSISGAPFSFSKYINCGISGANVGVVQLKNVSTSQVLPIGNAANYLPVTLSPASTSDFASSVFVGSTTNGTPTGTALIADQKANVVDAIWNINRTSGTGNCGVSFNWPASLEGATFTGFTNASDLGISHYNGNTWDTMTGSGDNTANTATATFSSFSPFMVGNLANVLPVQLTGISATIKTKGVDISWKVENEISILQYEVERSSNNGTFTYVGTVKANNNNSYSLNDLAPFTGTVYYRIKTVGIGGEIKYSPIVVVKKSNAGVSIYPNPASDILMVNGLNNATIKISSLIGQSVMQKITSGNTISLDISTLKRGMYLIEVANDGQKAINKIFIKE